MRLPAAGIGAAFLFWGAAVFAEPAADLDSILKNRVDESGRAAGIVAGIVDKDGARFAARGRVALDSPKRPDANTFFEIGSITKVFTSLLLCDMVERGEVRLDDPVSRYLPPSVKMPSRGGREITLQDLSMHVSGLPRMPNNFRPADFANPYVDYTPQRMYDFLSGYTLRRDIGERYEYSNLGAGLLGLALARRLDTTYELAIRRRILDPLGMRDTSTRLSREQLNRLARGHSSSLRPVKNWDFDAMAAAGAIRSTAADMLKFLAAHMGLEKTPLDAAMRRMRSVRRDTGVPHLKIALAWHILDQYGEIVWHNGGTAGYRAFAGFNPSTGKGVVVLCNTSADIDDIGRHLLDERYPVRMLKTR